MATWAFEKVLFALDKSFNSTDDIHFTLSLSATPLSGFAVKYRFPATSVLLPAFEYQAKNSEGVANSFDLNKKLKT